MIDLLTLVHEGEIDVATDYYDCRSELASIYIVSQNRIAAIWDICEALAEHLRAILASIDMEASKLSSSGIGSYYSVRSDISKSGLTDQSRTQ